MLTFSGSFTVGESGGNRGFSKSLGIGSAMSPAEFCNHGIEAVYTDGFWVYVLFDNTGTFPHAMGTAFANLRMKSLTINGTKFITNSFSYTNGRRWGNPLLSLDLIPASGTCTYEIEYDETINDIYTKTLVGSSAYFTGFSDGVSASFDVADGDYNRVDTHVNAPMVAYIGTDNGATGHPFVIGYTSANEANAPYGFAILYSSSSRLVAVTATINGGSSTDGTLRKKGTSMPQGLFCGDGIVMAVKWLYTENDLKELQRDLWKLNGGGVLSSVLKPSVR